MSKEPEGKDGDGKAAAAPVKEDARATQVGARLTKLLEVKTGAEKLVKSLVDPENACV